MIDLFDELVDQLHEKLADLLDVLPEQFSFLQEFAEGRLHDVLGASDLTDMDFNMVLDDIVANAQDHATEEPVFKNGVISFTSCDCWDECKAAGNVSKLRVAVFYS